MDHLRQQLVTAQVDAEKYSAMKIREAALDTQVKSMLEELREAKRSHTPVGYLLALLKMKQVCYINLYCSTFCLSVVSCRKNQHRSS